MMASEKQMETLVNLFKGGTKLTYKKGEYIIRPGEAPTGVFYIEEGLVKAFNISKYGEENLLIVRKNHELFPLIWAITGEDREIIYQALGPTTVWRIGREIFVDFLTKHPDSMPPLLDMIINQYKMHSERILNLEYRSVRERLISFLLTMSQRFGQEVADELVINVPLRHQDIASSINATRETTSREMAVLEKRGLLRNKQSLITLIDIEQLKNQL
jgi:CRP/FNR family transcriptional regulator